MSLVVLLAVYFTIPLFLLHGPIEADAHSLKALRTSVEQVEDRVALDRAQYVETPDGPRLKYYGGRVQMQAEGLDV